MTYETHSARVQLEHAIEDAIAFLDLIDGDTDLEPSLSGSYNDRYGVDGVDLEGDGADDEESGDEHEPSLGSLTSCYAAASQTNWAGGNRDDREDEHDGAELEEDSEHDGREPDVDDEDDELEKEEDGDYSGGGTGPGEDDAIFPGAGLAMLEHEAKETRRVAGWLADKVASLRDAKRVGGRP